MAILTDERVYFCNKFSFSFFFEHKLMVFLFVFIRPQTINKTQLTIIGISKKKSGRNLTATQ